MLSDFRQHFLCPKITPSFLVVLSKENRRLNYKRGTNMVGEIAHHSESFKFDSNNIKLHIYPIKGLTMEMLNETVMPALIICSSRIDRLIKAKYVDSFLAVHFLDTIDMNDDGSIKTQHAEVIKDFLFNLSPEITDLFICCDGGDSRSPAIAAAILKMMGRNDERIWKNPFYTPNILVYYIICQVFGIPVSWENVLEMRMINEKAYKETQMKNGQTGYKRWEIL